MKKSTRSALAALFLLFLLSGCGAPADTGPALPPSAPDETAPVPTELAPMPTENAMSDGDFAGVLAVGERADTFVAREDGTVWTAYWEDGGGASFWTSEDAAAKASAELVYAFDMKPRKLLIGQWTGLAIDGDGDLWGWGMCIPGAHDFSVPTTMRKILDDVADVEMTSNRAAALKIDGSLWTWGDPDLLRGDAVLASPEKRMEDVVSFCFDGTLLAVNSRGELYRIGPDGAPAKLAGDIRAVENGFLYGGDGTLYELSPEGVPQAVLPQAAQAVRLGAERALLLDAAGGVFLRESGAPPHRVSEGARLLIGTDSALLIDGSDQLCALAGDAAEVIDTDVLYAASTADFPYLLLYIKSDGTLWKLRSSVPARDDWYRAAPEKVLDGVALNR